mgnify:FL=1
MKKLIILLLVTLSLQAQKKIYFFGDSISYGVSVQPNECYAVLISNAL